jgi:hypothetical protein
MGGLLIKGRSQHLTVVQWEGNAWKEWTKLRTVALSRRKMSPRKRQILYSSRNEKEGYALEE